ncbi:MAG: hypothetical protein K9J37_08875 [Saprospiraceae bacterium]|nr:hypothetical protein [Saprospiraceae bacterium]MCF8250014.1 hypothetical protein [Saprospiraceae bacterium]MCF8278946.1 hypothetical protein [Bacteroidales bacterium]MCF8311027.1 hypothetical protein [Saprospiraceae bacterium]MCF8439637.1 hypothetical protein [Saprospiraceae bacterium]
MNPTSSHPSPSTHYRLDIVSEEVNKSHWIDSPFLYDNRSNDIIMHLYRLWEAKNVVWARQGEKVSMNLQHHADRSVTFLFEVDLEAGTATLSSVGYNVVLTGEIDGVMGEMQHTTELRTIFY